MHQILRQLNEVRKAVLVAERTPAAFEELHLKVADTDGLRCVLAVVPVGHTMVAEPPH